MHDKWLVVVDTTQIQDYIFQSNRLRENVGASVLVEKAAGEWAEEALKEVDNGYRKTSDVDDDDTSAPINAELVYSGGGNVVALFPTEKQVVQFERFFSLLLMQRAPGLKAVIARSQFQWDLNNLADAFKEAFSSLRRIKQSNQMSSPPLGFGVSAYCGSTGFPATRKLEVAENEFVLVSTETYSKHNAASADVMAAPEGFAFPYEFDQLGRTRDESSYIAVVHADGDAFGDEIRNIINSSATNDRNLLKKLASFSAEVSRSGKEAIQSTIESLVKRIDLNGGEPTIIHQNCVGRVLNTISLKKDKIGNVFLPFRPIVAAGDDLTFVCDGRLALSIADIYLRKFSELVTGNLRNAGLIDNEKNMSASAGVSIVKAHYPFAAAYELAVALTRSAKRYKRDEKIPGACIDWHIVHSGLMGTIGEIRKREYEVVSGKLTLRPMDLDSDQYRSLRAVKRLLATFQDDSSVAMKSEYWTMRRNKLKSLLTPLRMGEVAVHKYVSEYELELPELVNTHKFSETGWNSRFCGYFDALELVDLYVPIQ